MPVRNYTCGECGGAFVHQARGRPRAFCEDCAPIRAARKKAEWARGRSDADKRAEYRRSAEATKARAARWNRENPVRRSQITRRHYAKNRVAKAAYGRQWREANPDKVYAYSALHNARRRGLKVESSADNIVYLTALRNDPCSYCGGVGGEVDHIDPVSRGGVNDWTNFTAACRSCNPSKGTNTLLTYLLKKG